MRFWICLIVTSIRSSISLKFAFLLQIGMLLGSNAVFLAIWYVFFRKFHKVQGWHFSDMITLMGVVLTGYGLSKVLFGGVKQITRTIMTGNLDPFLTQPKNPLLHLVLSRSQPKGWGQILTGIAMIVFELPWPSVLLALLCALCGTLIFSSVTIIAHTIAFWMGPAEEISNKYSDSLFLFLHYPVNIYSGALKFFMFTFLPVGIIGYLPVELIQHFSFGYLIALLSSTAIFSGAALYLFAQGLKRYESGNQFGIRF